ncbi:hypothetical protein C8Q77DRAFT_1157972 [Trametes polyzona]|nr:hypothetical protein C8Q77DRAFT_1157972 [Trametes polyzona]
MPHLPSTKKSTIPVGNPATFDPSPGIVVGIVFGILVFIAAVAICMVVARRASMNRAYASDSPYSATAGHIASRRHRLHNQMHTNHLAQTNMMAMQNNMMANNNAIALNTVGT